MADYIAVYQNYLTQEKHASANTLSSYIRHLNQFHTWLLEHGVTDLRKVKKEHINISEIVFNNLFCRLVRFVGNNGDVAAF